MEICPIKTEADYQSALEELGRSLRDPLAIWYPEAGRSMMALLEGRCAFEATRKAKPAEIKQLRRLHDALEKHAAARNIYGYYKANHASA